MSHAGNIRVMLYSHDSWGLGHLRRSLAIAHALKRGLPGSSVLVATGSPSATAFPLAPGVDVIKLPSVTKDGAGHYQARQLNEDYASVMALRKGLLHTAFTEFKPDLLIVDHQLIGLSQEMLPLLKQAKTQGTHCIYGMRDVLDSVEVTEAAWDSPECRWALNEGYDEIWIYGDEQHFPTAQFYPALSETKTPLTYTGMITNGKLIATQRPSDKPHVLTTIGGGEDGGNLLRTYLDCLKDQPHAWDSTIVTGPMLHEAERTEIALLAQHLPSVTVHNFHDSIPGLMRSCDLVLSMAGYNTCAELVASRRPAILIPRTAPRQEQLIRAQYLELCGIAKCLVSPTPAELHAQIQTCLTQSRSPNIFPNTDGLDFVNQRCGQIARNRMLDSQLNTRASHS